MKINKSCRVLVWYELQYVRVFIHRVMQIPDILCFILTKSRLLNRFIFYLFLILSQTHDKISEINRKNIVSNVRRFYLENTCHIAVTSRCCWMKYRYALVLLQRNWSRCLFIVLGTIQLNKIKYARKRIFQVFLVWMGKSIPRATCSTTPSRWIFPSTPGTHERYF